MALVHTYIPRSRPGHIIERGVYRIQLVYRCTPVGTQPNVAHQQQAIRWYVATSPLVQRTPINGTNPVSTNRRRSSRVPTGRRRYIRHVPNSRYICTLHIRTWAPSLAHQMRCLP